MLSANLAAPLLYFGLQLFEVGLRPERGEVDAAGEQVFPFGGLRVGGHVRLPWLRTLGRAAVRDVGRVVLVRQAGEVMAELVNEYIRSEGIVRGYGREQVEDAPAAILPGIRHDFH